MNVEEIVRTSATHTQQFALLLERQRDLENQRSAIRAELREIDHALVRLTGVAVGDMIEVYAGERLVVNTISSSVFITDEFCRADAEGDRVYLAVSGTGSPVTKAGTPSKAEKHRAWNKVIRRVWITLEDYRKRCPVGD